MLESWGNLDVYADDYFNVVFYLFGNFLLRDNIKNINVLVH